MGVFVQQAQEAGQTRLGNRNRYEPKVRIRNERDPFTAVSRGAIHSRRSPRTAGAWPRGLPLPRALRAAPTPRQPRKPSSRTYGPPAPAPGPRGPTYAVGLGADPLQVGGDLGPRGVVAVQRHHVQGAVGRGLHPPPALPGRAAARVHHLHTKRPLQRGRRRARRNKGAAPLTAPGPRGPRRQDPRPEAARAGPTSPQSRRRDRRRRCCGCMLRGRTGRPGRGPEAARRGRGHGGGGGGEGGAGGRGGGGGGGDGR